VLPILDDAPRWCIRNVPSFQDCCRAAELSIATGRRLKLKDMKFFKQRFSAAPEGTAVLFFIQIFATLGFAVLYSTLVRFYQNRIAGLRSR
jgi:hypothetical protein